MTAKYLTKHVNGPVRPLSALEEGGCLTDPSLVHAVPFGVQRISPAGLALTIG